MVEQAVAETLQILEISNRALASLLNMDPHTLLENKKKNWAELTPTTKRKFWVTCTLVNKEFRLLRGSKIIEILNEHVFEDVDGFKDSVLSAIESDKYTEETILNIGRIAHKIHLEKELKKSAKLPDALPA